MFSGLKKVLAKLSNMARRNPITADRTMRKHALEMRYLLGKTKYPPEMADQKYQRTGLLKNSYFVRRISSGKYSLGNSAPYAKFVVDRKRQAWMHKNPHRSKRGSYPWYRVQDITDSHASNLPRKLLVNIMQDYE